MKLEDHLAFAESELKTTHENAKRLMEDTDRTRKYVASTDLIKEVCNFNLYLARGKVKFVKRIMNADRICIKSCTK